MALDEDIKIIELPQNGIFKVVQLFVDKHPVMICGIGHHKYLLGDYLRSVGIEPEIIIKNTTIEKKKLPALKGERYSVVGMDGATIIQMIRYFQLPFGKSIGYGIEVNGEFDEQLRKQFDGWNF